MTSGLASSNDRFGRLGVALVGYGSIGRRHAENLAALGADEVLLVRRRGNVNRAFTPREHLRVVNSMRHSIDAGIDLAIVCTPTSLHTSTAREYVAAGIPVLIEKPLSHSLDDAELLAREAAGRAAGMAYCMRYHPAYSMARDCIRQGRLGSLELADLWFESYLPDWHPWEDYRQSYAARADLGGGVLPTLDHEIDFANWCFGLPKRCSGKSWRSGTLDMEVDDSAVLTLEYPTHAAEIRLSLCRRERRRGFTFVGSNGRLKFSFERQRLEYLRRGEQSAQVLWDQADFDINTVYLAMLEDVLMAVAARRRLPVPLAAGVEALRVIDQVHHV